MAAYIAWREGDSNVWGVVTEAVNGVYDGGVIEVPIYGLPTPSGSTCSDPMVGLMNMLDHTPHAAQNIFAPPQHGTPPTVDDTNPNLDYLLNPLLGIDIFCLK